MSESYSNRAQRATEPGAAARARSANAQNYPQPSEQWIASVILEFARRRYWINTWPGEKPLWGCHLQHPKLGKQVYVELMPSLALRVRDRQTGETLAQSLPGNMEVLDDSAPGIQEMFEAWQQSRETRVEQVEEQAKTAPVVQVAPVEPQPKKTVMRAGELRDPTAAATVEPQPSIEKAFEAWQQSRETAPVVAAAPVEQHPTTNPNPNPGGDL